MVSPSVMAPAVSMGALRNLVAAKQQVRKIAG
jgi:hypothetical protein